VYSAEETRFLEARSGVKTADYRFSEDRALHLTGILLAEYGAAVFDGSTHLMEKNPMGKPYFKDSGLHFNITHSGDIAACGFSLDPVGVDVECPKRSIEDVVRRFFREEEIEWISRDGYSNAKAALIWSYKESFLKQKGSSVGEIEKLKPMVCEGQPVSYYEGTRFFWKYTESENTECLPDSACGYPIVACTGAGVGKVMYREIPQTELSQLLNNLAVLNTD
jgi:phosphopantetheinyl transferase